MARQHDESGSATTKKGRKTQQGKCKIKYLYINDTKDRQAKFRKWATNLIKRADELSVLCGCEISLMIFQENPRNYREYQTKSTSLQKLQSVRTDYLKETLTSEYLGWTCVHCSSKNLKSPDKCDFCGKQHEGYVKNQTFVSTKNGLCIRQHPDKGAKKRRLSPNGEGPIPKIQKKRSGHTPSPPNMDVTNDIKPIVLTAYRGRRTIIGNTDSKITRNGSSSSGSPPDSSMPIRHHPAHLPTPPFIQPPSSGGQPPSNGIVRSSSGSNFTRVRPRGPPNRNTNESIDVPIDAVPNKTAHILLSATRNDTLEQQSGSSGGAGDRYSSHSSQSSSFNSSSSSPSIAITSPINAQKSGSSGNGIFLKFSKTNAKRIFGVGSPLITPLTNATCVENTLSSFSGRGSEGIDFNDMAWLGRLAPSNDPNPMNHSNPMNPLSTLSDTALSSLDKEPHELATPPVDKFKHSPSSIELKDVYPPSPESASSLNGDDKSHMSNLCKKIKANTSGGKFGPPQNLKTTPTSNDDNVNKKAKMQAKNDAKKCTKKEKYDSNESVKAEVNEESSSELEIAEHMDVD